MIHQKQPPKGFVWSQYQPPREAMKAGPGDYIEVCRPGGDVLLRVPYDATDLDQARDVRHAVALRVRDMLATHYELVVRGSWTRNSFKPARDAFDRDSVIEYPFPSAAFVWRRPGRPRSSAQAARSKRTAVYMPDDCYQALRAAGGGNLSAGVRLAWQALQREAAQRGAQHDAAQHDAAQQ